MTDCAQGRASPVDPGVLNRPLTELTRALAAGQLSRAKLILAQACWTSLAAALRTLPERDRFIAYQLLERDAAREVCAGLCGSEQAQLRTARAVLSVQPAPGCATQAAGACPVGRWPRGRRC